jgi:tetratricopeptide (TPR) repeat protein
LLNLIEEIRMSEHPRRETLEGLLLNGLLSREVKATVAHLLGGCDRCRNEMSPLSMAMFTPDTAPEPHLSAAEENSYDRAISAAFTRALAHEQTLRVERETADWKSEELLQALQRSETPSLPEGPASWGLCETLLEKGRTMRHDDPAGMLHLANLARQAADRLDPAVYGAERRTDMQARAWAELANAYRITDDFAQAEAAMACALDLRSQGTGDPLLYARVADLNASLLCDQRRFKEAFRMLDLAYAIHRRHSDSHEVGRVVVLKGLYTGYAGKPEEGLQLLVRGLSMIDRARDSKLVFHTLHNILLFRVELGEYDQARRQLQGMRPLYAAHASWLDLVKLHRLEGQIAAGLGDLVTAEATFQQICQDLNDAGLGYQASLFSLDLAGVWLRQGRTAEVRGLVAEMVVTFRVLGVEREAMSALSMLQDALQRDQATLEVLRLASGILRRLQNEPATRAGLDTL